MGVLINLFRVSFGNTVSLLAALSVAYSLTRSGRHFLILLHTSKFHAIALSQGGPTAVGLTVADDRFPVGELCGCCLSSMWQAMCALIAIDSSNGLLRCTLLLSASPAGVCGRRGYGERSEVSK